MNLYKKRPATVEAEQWTGENHEGMFEFFGWVWAPGRIFVAPREWGVGSFVVRESGRAVRWVSAEEFRATYEPLF